MISIRNRLLINILKMYHLDVLTHSKQHRTGTLTATGPSATITQHTPLLGHQVILQRLYQQIFTLRVVAHQQLRVHVTHQEVPRQQRQTHTLHQLEENIAKGVRLKQTGYQREGPREWMTEQ